MHEFSPKSEGVSGSVRCLHPFSRPRSQRRLLVDLEFPGCSLSGFLRHWKGADVKPALCPQVQDTSLVSTPNVK